MLYRPEPEPTGRRWKAMNIVIIKSPKALRKLLRRIFRMK